MVLARIVFLSCSRLQKRERTALVGGLSSIEGVHWRMPMNICQEKFKRIDPIVKFLSNVTEAEKNQVKKDIANSTFDPDHP